MFVNDYLPPQTFSALRFLVKAIYRQHGTVSPEAMGDLARLTLSRDIDTAAVVRAMGMCGIPTTR
ncbi:MAG TPA: hypothetical protein VK196_22595 [Magnetospirillum sp.]|nr:hypothetical protein [Magnetospirillum sp.]